VDDLHIRRARREDIAVILEMMTAEATDPTREQGATAGDYEAAFDAIEADQNQLLVVAETGADGVVGTMQLTFIPGLSRRGAWRLLLENVHVSEAHRNKGLGAALVDWACREGARRGCAMVQLTSHSRRVEAHRFYGRLGFVPSHVGFKRTL
jgi:predicted N-acetyltransferase YhbS